MSDDHCRQTTSLRYSRQMLLPEFGVEGQRAARRRARADCRRRRAGVAGGAVPGGGGRRHASASSTSTRSTRRTCSGRSSTAPPTSAAPKLDVAAARLRAHQSARRDRAARRALRRRQCARASSTAYDVVIDGTDNFATRYLVNDACVMAGTPNVYGSVFRFEGQVVGVRDAGRPVLSLPASEPPPAGLDSQLRGGRRARRAAGRHRHDSGDRSDQADRRHRRAARSAACCSTTRCGCASAQIALPRDPACPVCGDAPTIRELVGVRSASASPQQRGEPARSMT